MRNGICLDALLTGLCQSLVLRARWMHDSDRYEHTKVLKVFQDATELYQKYVFSLSGICCILNQTGRWESGWFHLGQFQDECFKGLSPADQLSRYVCHGRTLFLSPLTSLLRGTRMNLQTVRCYGKAIRFGSKYIYQTVPRLLTLWLDMGEHKEISQTDIFGRINKEVAKVIQTVPTYKVRLRPMSAVLLFTVVCAVVHRVPSDRLSRRPQ